MPGRVHLIIGPVGAGKSTFARALATKHGALRLILDDWMAVLYGDDERPVTGRLEWYLERRDRCLARIWQVARDAAELGTNVVLEVGLIQRLDRHAFYERVDAAGFELVVYVVDAPRDVRRERVMRRNEQRGETFAQVVPLEFFELASDHWEPPDERETHARAIRMT